MYSSMKFHFKLQVCIDARRIIYDFSIKTYSLVFAVCISISVELGSISYYVCDIDGLRLRFIIMYLYQCVKVSRRRYHLHLKFFPGHSRHHKTHTESQYGQVCRDEVHEILMKENHGLFIILHTKWSRIDLSLTARSAFCPIGNESSVSSVSRT